ncbi:MAG: 5-oxoprolinase subunit PxpB [Firmicutes bacterium]|nr:5-oxoprolinase subunit PxpB [Bacillota bacterium]
MAGIAPIVLADHLTWCEWARLAGDGALLLSFGETPSVEVNRQVHRVARLLDSVRWEGLLAWVPAYTTLLVEFDPAVWTPQDLLAALDQALASWEPSAERGWVWEVPVLYGGSHGPDLAEVAQRLGISPDEVIRLHTSTPYRIYCLGFSPGFPLAGLLPPPLRLPRRNTPRTAVYPGAVAIAGAQTGIYPLNTPGGWHLIGCTPVPLFDWSMSPPTPYQPGDALWFRSISADEFDALWSERERGRLQLKRVTAS